jgi:hypothetical protein
MKINRTLLAAMTVATIGAGAIGATRVFAATNTDTTMTNPMSGLVSAIATKFNLNQADVQQVFDDQRAKMQTEHQQAKANKLSAAVTAGTITQAQADAIIPKETEMKTFRDTLKDKTETERQAAMKTEMTSLQDWAKTNNIPTQFIPFGMRGGHGPGGMHRPDGDADDSGVTSSTSATTTTTN